MTIFDLIFTALKDGGIDVYAPDTHEGKCTADYVVVKEAQRTQFLNFSSTTTYYDILCYSPTFTGVLQLSEKAEEIMKTAEPSVMPTYNKTQAYLDPDIKGYMISIEYRNYKKI